MKAEQARALAEEYNPDITKVCEIIKNKALNGEFSTSNASELLYDQRVRNRLKTMGYKITWIDLQLDGYWEISW